MKIETERLVLRSIDESHVEDILKIRSNEIVNQFVKRISPKTNYDALDFILTIKKRVENKETFYWGISLKDQTYLIGTICLYRFSEDRTEAEVGYELLPAYHRKGIMSETLTAVLNFGFNELYLNEILAFTNKFNENSKSLLLKHQFTLEEGRVDEGFPDNLVFSLKK
ncbi:MULTISPECIES: GNAT family N-acetyltransferase [unclassified Chryseobacterium]|jgi:ribosomal-protein-alanine N-acetyltransferase|uniref:GNAT family N-acetyltransferase n=1 Tax=unclassified Chryseobacterium TaxID=2593645 RepID=UPI001C5BA61B|nr:MULTISPECIES: GNAT family N-acetyltransferase [unclassified Chryseobacterium]MBW3523222.1 GNAT family N-acetyltransferase [Chryseobacterium sp. NKUCC03_KSP]MCD0455467.1 GNAT family N-acetyltransferase [Chryseobacterium sp. LC2016-27]